MPNRLFLVLALVVAALGCDRNESISFSQAPKEAAPATRPVAMAPVTSSTAPLSWRVPAGWKEQQSSQQMRFATFVVNEGNPPVEFTVIPLGAEAGELLPNLNRWEGQLGLPSSSKEQADKIVKHTHINGLHADVVDLTSADSASPRQRMLAAIIPHAGRVWFFKMVGPEPIVSAQKQNFDAFMNSLTPGPGGDSGSIVAAPAPSAGASQQPGMQGEAFIKPTSSNTIKNYTAPEDWRKLDAKPPRVIAFDIGPAEAKAELVVTKFAKGNAGPFLENVNRWRGQIGLGPVSDPNALAMQDAAVGSTRGVILDFHNPDASPPKRMLVCLASHADEFWFFKLTGPADLVDKQREPFVAFLKSVEFAQ
ncbi:MAG TPA: hypothetical protein VF669_05070 [Tepidisphaeraceae bacterium]|jgi:hypothetical protein